MSKYLQTKEIDSLYIEGHYTKKITDKKKKYSSLAYLEDTKEKKVKKNKLSIKQKRKLKEKSRQDWQLD